MAIALSFAGLAITQTAYFPIMQDGPMKYPIRYAFGREGKEPPIVDGRAGRCLLEDYVGPEDEFQLTDAAADKGR